MDIGLGKSLSINGTYGVGQYSFEAGVGPFVHMSLIRYLSILHNNNPNIKPKRTKGLTHKTKVTHC